MATLLGAPRARVGSRRGRVPLAGSGAARARGGSRAGLIIVLHPLGGTLAAPGDSAGLRLLTVSGGASGAARPHLGGTTGRLARRRCAGRAARRSKPPGRRRRTSTRSGRKHLEQTGPPICLSWTRARRSRPVWLDLSSRSSGRSRRHRPHIGTRLRQTPLQLVQLCNTRR